ncbi:MAG: RNA methyltransferase, partial [Bacteroidales bacterium]|nr:RNA methyltransferase [Bacteroidales bacterium]
MISNKQTKLILSLQKKKQRDALSLYLIEGDKLIREYLEAGEHLAYLAAYPEWLETQPKQLLKKAETIIEVDSKELKKISSLSTPHNALAIVRMKTNKLYSERFTDGLTIALDKVQDPGNMGTIIRVAAWFGIKNIV